MASGDTKPISTACVFRNRGFRLPRSCVELWKPWHLDRDKGHDDELGVPNPDVPNRENRLLAAGRVALIAALEACHLFPLW